MNAGIRPIPHFLGDVDFDYGVVKWEQSNPLCYNTSMQEEYCARKPTGFLNT